MKLLDYLPESYQDSPETVDLLQSMGHQTSRLFDRYLDFLDQMQVCTASWGLSFWEQVYGIPVDVSKPDQERREVLYSKMRAIGSVTPEMIRNIAAAFSQGEPIVTEFPGEYRFMVWVTESVEQRVYWQNLYAVLEQMKPAHLAMKIMLQINRKFRYHLPIGFAGAVGAAYKGEPVNQDRTAITPVPVSYGGFLTSGQTGSPSDVRTEVTAHTNGGGGMFCYTHTKSKLIE